MSDPWRSTKTVHEASYTKRARFVRRQRRRVRSWFTQLPHSFRHTILRPAFWLGMTLGFPLEHLLWEKAPIFKEITAWLGL